MENFLSNFANTNTEVTSSNAKLSATPEFYGTIDICKGALKMTITFYARVYRTRFENYISLDDWDINETSHISLGGMPINNLNLLITTMVNSGLTTAAKGLDISNEDNKREICIQLEQFKMFKDVFGKKARMLDILSDEEKKKVMLKFAIDNYDKMTLASEEVKNYITTDDEGNKVMPTIEQLTNQLNN